MRVISSLALVAGISSAAILAPRDTATVLSDISDIDTQVKSLATAVNGFNSIAQAPALISAESGLDSAIQKATSDAKATSALSDSDASSILSAVKSLIPDIVTALNAVVSKASTFTSAGVASVVSGDLTQLKSDTDAFAGALMAIAPSGSKAAASAAVSCIDAAFVAAQATSSASAACASDISVGSGGSGSSSSGSSSPTTSSGGSSSASSKATSGASSSSTPTSAASSASSSKATSTPTSSGVAQVTGAPTASPSTIEFTGAATSLQGGLAGVALAAALVLLM